MKLMVRGFTLIEVMVVLLVIAFAVSAVVIRFQHREAQSQARIHGLLRFLQQAQEAAIFGNRSVGVACREEADQAIVCRQQYPATGEGRAASNVFVLGPDWIRKTLPGVAGVVGSERETAWLSVRFYPGGEVTPLIFGVHHASRPDQVWLLRSEDINGVRLENWDAAFVH